MCCFPIVTVLYFTCHISVRSVCSSLPLFLSDDLELELEFLECLELSELELECLDLVSSTCSSAFNASCSNASSELSVAFVSSFSPLKEKIPKISSSSMNFSVSTDVCSNEPYEVSVACILFLRLKKEIMFS